MWVKFGQVPEAYHVAWWRYNGNIIIVMENMGSYGVSVNYWMGMAEAHPYSLGAVGEYRKDDGYQPVPEYLQHVYYLEDAEIVEA